MNDNIIKNCFIEIYPLISISAVAGDLAVLKTALFIYVFRVCGQVEPVYQAIWADNSDFQEVLVSPTMVNDHMPDNVLEALEKVYTCSQSLFICLMSKIVQKYKYSIYVFDYKMHHTIYLFLKTLLLVLIYYYNFVENL